MRAVLIVLIASAAFASFGCDSVFDKDCPDNFELWVEYQLFMGRSGPDGDIVDDAEWDAFLADAVTPRFPDGLTVLDGNGQWRGAEGQIQREESKILIILTPIDDEQSQDLIEQVVTEYKTRFEQESVLKTVDKTCVAF